MPTRLYLTSEAAEITPTVKGTWGGQSGVVSLLGREPSGAASSTNQSSSGSPKTALLYRLVSKPLAAQTISGTVSAVVMASVNSSDGTLRCRIYVTEGDSTSAVRGTLLTLGEGPEETITTTLTGRPIDSTALSSVNAQGGDRLVIEVGAEQAGTSITMSRGGTGSDQTSGGTNTANPGWFLFSGDILFGGPAVRAWICE